MTILEALAARTIFGAAFGDAATWRAWAVFLAACFGLDLTEEQLALYRRHTGRQTPPRESAREVWCIAGRRAGKSRIAALLAVFVAVFLHDFAKLLAPGERAVVAVIACDRAQAAVVFRYVCALLEAVPMLRQLIVRRTQSTVELANGAVIEIGTCSSRSTRGFTFACVIADEAAFWRSETSAEPDVEVLNAVRPGLATIPDSMLIAISSPYSRRGALWTAYREHYGKDGDPILVWQSSTVDMNPSVDPAIIAAAYEADPAAAAAEYGGQFRADLETFVSRETIAAAIVPGRVGLPPMPGGKHLAFCDASGGAGADAFTLAVAHREDRDGTGVAVLDYLDERRPPFNPSAVIGEYAAVLTSYGLTAVQADKYAAGFVVEAFGKHGITCTQSAAPKSDLYRELLPLLNSGRVELLDHPRLAAQLGALERRTTRGGGRDVIDHPPNAHDDLANAAAGALVAAVGERGRFTGFLDYAAAGFGLHDAPAPAEPAPEPPAWGRPLPPATDAQRAARRQRALEAFEKQGGYR